MARRRNNAPTLRKSPAQERSRVTVDAILDAAARILLKRGYDAFTTNVVAAQAGVSIGSLYQYFPNKEALLSELLRRHTLEFEAGLQSLAPLVESAPLRELIGSAIEQIARSHLIDPALHRVLSDAPPLGKLHWEMQLNERLTATVRSALEARRAEITAPDLDLAAYVVTQAVEAIIHNAATERLTDLRSGLVAKEVTRMLVGYLTERVRR